MKFIYNTLWGMLCTLLILLAAPTPPLLAQPPSWSVNPADYANTMTITAELSLNCERSTDLNDMVGIFDEFDNCRGVVNVIQQFGDYYVFLTAYSNVSSDETLSLKIYDDSENVVVDAVNTIDFVSNAILGTIANPRDIRDNHQPTDININSSGIQENQAVGTVVGAFTTADEDDTAFTYSLVEGDGSDNNNSFSIDGIDLKSAEVFDMEEKDNYTIRVRTTDDGGCFYEEIFNIIVNDGNDPPIAMSASNIEVAENEDIGTVIGGLTSTDPDPDDTHTYSLVPGIGDDDNAFFAISGENLVTDEMFDFETKSTYTIRLQTNDGNGGTYQEQFTITITDANDAPTAIALDNNSIAENEDLNTWIATLSSSDQDAADSHTYTLVEGEGDEDNASFSISNGDLVSNESFNFEAKDTYTIRLQTDDGNGGTYQEQFTINITDTNDAPTDMDLSSYDVEENKDSNTFIAAITTTDEDPNDSFTYSLVEGEGDEDNGSFQVVDGQVFSDETFDFEAKDSYFIRIQTDDGNGGTFEEVMNITIIDRNDAPTGMELDNLFLNENEAKLTHIGSLSTIDEDATDDHSYELTNGSGDDDNSSFIIQGSKIMAASSFNFETKSLYTLRVQTTDKDNETYSTSFTITIGDVNDVPSDLAASSQEVAENQPEGTVVATFQTADEDTADEHTYSFVNLQPNDHDAFYVMENTLRTNKIFDYETDSTYIVYIETNDGNGGTLMEQFFIKITNTNDAPTALSMSTNNVDENESIGTTVATLSSTDIDAGDSFTYSLVNGGGSEDNLKFTISGNLLQTAETFNFEEKDSYLIRLRTTDSGGKSYEQAVTININDTNDVPTDLLLDNIYFNENLLVSTVVSNLSSIDEDPNDNHFYSLVSGEGSTDNSHFSIVGGLLLANTSFDYEAKDSYSIRIRTQDNDGGSFEKQATIFIVDANENPTELSINNLTIAENEPFASFIGVLNTIDPDLFDTHFYSFADVTPNNNGSFVIVEDELRSFEVFDYETQNFYVVHIETNDGNGGSFVQQFALQIEDANDAPTAIALSSNTIAENLPTGSTVGFFQTTDQDVADNFTYTLVDGFGAEDNASFQIVGSELQSAEIFDIDTKDTYSILVRTDDGRGGSFEQLFNIIITDANDAPSALVISNKIILENNMPNEVVGIFATTDADGADSFTYQLVEGEGAADNGSFSINGNELLASETFNFEVKSQYSIRVQSDDGNGGTIEDIFLIAIQNANDAPTALQLDNATIEENQAVSTLVGVLTTTDEDENDVYVYSFKEDGSSDNASFILVGNELRTFTSFDYEEETNHYVNIKVTDSGNKSHTEQFLITITDNNDPPTDIQLSSNTIAENLVAGSKVGDFSASDEDTADSFTYSLAVGIGDTDNSNFQIVGTELQSTTMFDLDSQDSYQIRVRVTDAAGSSHEEIFSIQITDANDAPMAMSMNSQQIDENQSVATLVGSFSTTDSDINDNFTYSLVVGTGDTDNGSFGIVENQLLSAEVFNFEEKNSYMIRVETNDGNGGTFQEVFNIAILDKNDAPISISLSNQLIAENQSLNTVIGTLSTVDEDADNSFLYTFDNSISNDNEHFSIVDNEVRTNANFNFEANNSYNIAVQTNDGNGGTLTEQFSIQITNANDLPTALQLSSNTIAENLASGSKVGTFTSTDEDANDSFTYSLVGGIGSDNNISFQIVGDELQSAEMFDLDTKEVYQIRVQTSDGQGGTFETTFNINITDANDAPTALAMDKKFISENQAVGALVGTFSTTDSDVNDNFTYTLVGENNDNGSFAIQNNQLQTQQIFNFEVKNSYKITVQTDDGNGGTLREDFLIQITDANDLPTELGIENMIIAENENPNSLVGTFFTKDEDENNNFSYSFVNEQTNNNNRFIIAGNELRTLDIFNYEAKAFYQIYVQSNDGLGGTITRSFVIDIANVNDLPTNIELSSNTIAENLAANSTVGFFTSEDEDASETFSYQLVAGNGGQDNTAFQIVGNELQSNMSFDLDAKDSYSIRIQTKDSNGGTYEEVFNIVITDANDAPTALALNNLTVFENQEVGTVIGTLSTQDADANDNFTYSLVSGMGDNDNALFSIFNQQLVTATKFNYELQDQYMVRLQTSDGNGGTFEQMFTIKIVNQNDQPTQVALSNTLVEENQVQGTIVGTFETTDEDVADDFTYTFMDGAAYDHSVFAIVDNVLLINEPFNFEAQTLYNIQVQSNDGNGGTIIRQFTINVLDANDTPTDIALSSNTIAENLPSASTVGFFTTTDEDVNTQFTYALVAGMGSEDNTVFQIVGNELRSTAMFDLDTKETYSIRVRVSDGQGGTLEEVFSIQITDANDAPTAINLNNFNLLENQPIGTIVGAFTTVDVDAFDSFTYKLVAGIGGNDNHKFSISDNQLVSNTVFNYEEQSSYTIRVRTEDGNGGQLDVSFVIQILDENDLPTAMQLSQSSIPENETVGTLIGTLTTSDEDTDDTFTYTLTENLEDNHFFIIEGNELRSKGSFNFEEQAFYQIAIEVNDGNGGTFIQEWVISITNENDAPHDLQVTSLTIAENLPVSSTVGFLETADEDAAESFTYSLVSGEGSSGNSQFKIVGSELQSNVAFDLDAQDSYSIRIQTTDSQGSSIVRIFTVLITDANDAPTALLMDIQQVSENQQIGTLISQLSTQDPDAQDSFTYQLVNGTGSQDNSSFVIVDNQLLSNVVFNFEVKNSYNIRLQTNDGNGGTLEKSFVIEIADANDQPTDLTLSNAIIAESQAAGTVVGSFSTTDEDAADSFTYKFINSNENDNAKFSIEGNVLQTNVELDFEVQAFHTIEVETNDGNGGTYSLQFTITVTNTNEDAPTAISLTRNNVPENQVIGTLVGKLSTQDIDGGSNFVYSLAAGGADNHQFTIDGDALFTNAVFNYEVKNSYQIRVQTEDDNGDAFQDNFTILITDENDQPTNVALSNNKVTEEQASGVTVGVLSTTDEDVNDSFTYTLVNEGANDNDSFVIQGNTLQTNRTLDYETQPFLLVAVQTDDGQGGSFVKQLTIEVVDSNEDSPTAISITRNNVPENQVIGTIVGKFSTQDIDGGGNFVYTLAEGVADNDLFAIDADVLLTNTVFNYEAQNSYQILVKTEDESGNAFEENFTILITDENDEPTALNLSNNQFGENQFEGTIIGFFSTNDEDANDIYSYRFVDLQMNDNDLFSIVGGELRSNTTFNFEEKQTYSIDVETDDNRGGKHQQSFQVVITDNNDVPTGLSLSNQSIAENQAIGTLVGMLNAMDEDVNDNHTYTLVPGLGGDDNDLFSIVGNELVSNAVFDLEVQAELKVRILTTDAAGTSFDAPFIITVRDENDAPTLLSLSSQTIAENQAIGTVVGTFNTTDPDGGDEHAYELIEGVGGDHNDLFSIQDNVLFSSAVFDFEVQNSFSILVKSSDGQADGIQQAFTVTVLDANDAPAAIALSPASVPENEAIGTYVGTLSAMDQDAADSHQFELVNSGSGNNNDHFSIVNNELRTFKVLDFEAQPTYFIEVEADDMRGGTLTQVLSVEVTDANDAPTALVLTHQQVVENAAMGSMIGMFMTTDIDAADSHTYSLVEGVGSQDNTAFGIEGANLVLNTTLDINTKDAYSIRVAATDLGGKAIAQSFQIQVMDANNTPTAILLSNLSIRENEASGTIIGSLLAEDADLDDEHTFELVTNDNAPHSEWFKIVDGQLMSAITFNYELNPSLQIAVVTTDLQGSTFEQAFTIEVVNVNESPMILSESFSIAENSDESSTIGTIEATDEDLGQTLTFALVNESDVPFKLDASTGELTLATNRLDYEEQAFYSLEIEVSDNGNPVLSASKTIEVRVEDLIETTQTLPANNYLSPNNDGSNDYFDIQNVELYADFELTIFNANGEEIFYQASNYQNDWDGTFDGEILPTGVYYYLFQNPNDSEEVFKGTISIVK